jgi:hypothetical protein
MGDLPGSPSVAPSPLFCTAPWGGGGGAAASPATAPTLPDGAEPDCVGVRGLPRGAGGDRSVVNTAARGRDEPRRCLHRSTQRRRWPRNLRLFFRLLPSFLFLFPPAFFCFRARGVAPGAQVAESGAGPRSGRVIPLRAAAPRRGEQTLGRSVWDRAFLVAALPSPTAR